MKEEYKKELKQYMQAAVDKLPFIPTPYLKQGVVGMERIKIGITNEATYSLHERVVKSVFGETNTLTIVQDLVQGDIVTKGSSIVNSVIKKVSGFDELARSDGFMSEEIMLFATIGLLIAFSECSRFEIPSKRPSAGIRKI
jgi:hypothetical protein